MFCLLLLLLLFSSSAQANNLTCPISSIRQLSPTDVANYTVIHTFGVEFINLISPITEILVDNYFRSNALPNKGKFILTDDFIFTGLATEGVDYASQIYYVSEFNVAIISNGSQDNLIKSFTVDTSDEVYFPIYPLVPTNEIRFTINNFSAPVGQGYYWRMRLFGCNRADAVPVKKVATITSTVTMNITSTTTTNIISTVNQCIVASSSPVPLVTPSYPTTGYSSVHDEMYGVISSPQTYIPTANDESTANTDTTIQQQCPTRTPSTVTVTSLFTVRPSPSLQHIDNCSTTAVNDRTIALGAVSSNGVGYLVLSGIVAPLLVLILILVMVTCIGTVYIWRRNTKYRTKSLRPRSATVKELNNVSLYGESLTTTNPYEHYMVINGGVRAEDNDDMVSNRLYESSGTVLITNDEYSTIDEAKRSTITDS